MNRASETVKTKDGVAISFYQYSDVERDTAVIICPGFFQSKETPTFKRMSEAIAKGRDVITMDFRGHGRSTGLYTFSAKEDADLNAVLSFARLRYRSIGIMGFSLGAAISINTVNQDHDNVKAVIAVGAPYAFEEIEFKFWTPDAMVTGLQGCEQGAGCRPGSPFLDKERPIDTIRRFREVPILFMHGTSDTIVDARHSRELYAAAPDPKRLELVEGGSHAEALFRDDPYGFIDCVNAWLNVQLM